MFDVGFLELLMISALALILLGPKDFQKALFFLGKMLAMLRSWVHTWAQALDPEASPQHSASHDDAPSPPSPLIIEGEVVTSNDPAFDEHKASKE
jgi:Sec-independent protein translocase protein TatA